MGKIIYSREEEKFNEAIAELITLGIASALCGLIVGGLAIHENKELEKQNKQAIIFGENTATIVDIKKTLQDDGYTNIETKDGLKFTIPTRMLGIIDLNTAEITAEDMVISIMGTDVEIRYLSAENIIDVDGVNITYIPEEDLTYKLNQ